MFVIKLPVHISIYCINLYEKDKELVSITISSIKWFHVNCTVFSFVNDKIYT